MRIFQLAQELHVNSQEILDALEDMGQPAKSNLAVLDDALVAELRELFKPKPTPAKSVKDEALKRAQAEREAREKALRETARREEERKNALRRAAIARRAGAHPEAEVEGGAHPELHVEAEGPLPEAFEAPAVPALPVAQAPIVPPEISGKPVPTEPEAVPHLQPPAAHPVEPPAPVLVKAEEVPAEELPPPAAAAPQPAAPVAPPVPAPVSRLGKAVIAPPPTSAKERAELLGRPLGQAPRQVGRRPQAQAPSAPARHERPAAPAASARPERPAAPSRPERPAAPARPERQAPPPRPDHRRGKEAPGRAKGQPQAVTPAPTPRFVEPEPPVGEVKISDGITVKDLSERMDRKAKDVIKRLFLEKGILATINHALDIETARWVVEAFGGQATEVGMEEEAVANAALAEGTEAMERLFPRPPVVTVMGHVDHGKTSLLDAIRQTRVAEREAGGITQHIGAYKVTQQREGQEKEIVFLDTPGHEAFTLMRARGARVTDIVILVVAADDGVMPQTIESINHAKAAGVPLIVAVNKIDKPNANPDRVLQQLADRGVLVEQFGGETVSVQVSAKQKRGIDELLDMVLLVSEMLELRSNPDRPANGTVLEAKLDKARGPVATVLVQNGSLRAGDVFVVGSAFGRVRALVDERDRRLEAAGPSTPVVVIGLEEVPQAGDLLQVFPEEAKARQIAHYRAAKQKEEEGARRAKLPTLETLGERIIQGQVNEVPLVVKADVQGSVEVLRKSLEDLSTEEVRVKVIHSGTGAITETDILLASTSNALVIGFNVRPDRSVSDIAKREGVDIRLHTVIYNVVDEIKQAMLNTLSPVEKVVELGRAEIRQVFKIAKIGTVAGCYVTDGIIRRDAHVRLLRDNVVIHEGRLGSLRRFKDDAKEVRSGFECGMNLERYQDIKPGDIIEAFTIEFTRRDSLVKS